MKELSLHILDLVQNSLYAQAQFIEIFITEDTGKNTYTIVIKDDGYGMTNEELSSVIDPFYTTKKKKTGLGVPLMKQHAEMANGKLTIISKKNEGTVLTAIFQHDHIDRQPLGDIIPTIILLVQANPQKDFYYYHYKDGKYMEFDTRIIKNELDGIPINTPEIIEYMKDALFSELTEIGVV